ncbi:MAG TPA: hypothetical protein VFO60_10460, partial [Candidatus Dormibacteraeota bacterium]|nr:hypothetical protein [Candidatus Dormibacteraeota bacterium]
EVDFHTLITVSTNGGQNLLQGNSENTSATSAGWLTDISAYRAVAEQRYPGDEVAQDAYYRSSAISWIEANKGKAAVLYVEKVANYFNYRNDLATSGAESRAVDAIAALSYLPLVLLLAVRVATYRRRVPSALELLLTAIYLGNALLMAVAYTRIRFRAPLDPLLICVVAAFVAAIAGARLAAGPRESPAAAARAG